MEFTLSDIIAATNAKVLKNYSKEHDAYLISTDTRTIEMGQLFLPLKGENYNGEDFIEKAVQRGASAVICTKTCDVDCNLILQVEDTTQAYLQLAKYYKDKVNPKVVAITGSSGKTTTKEMAYSVIREKYSTHCSELNYNNEIGLCRTILSMPRRTEVLIVEMGMRGLGEIELLSQYAEPDISIITNIGTSHIGRLGSKENIAKAKCEIISHQKPNGILIAKADKLVSDIVGDAIYYSFENAHITQRKSTKQKFEYQGYEYEIGVIGDHNVENAMAVIELGHYLNIDDELIAAGLLKFKPIRKRWEVEEINGIKIINDAYNANPDSMKASIKTSMDNYPSVLFVLGDMAELGDKEVEYHKEIGEYLKEFNGRLLKVATVGKLAKEISDVLADTEIESVNFETKEGVAKYILDNASFGTTIVLKASRSMKLEDVVEEIRNAK